MISKPELLRFVYDDFKSTSDIAVKMSRETMDCSGNWWRLTLYPHYPTVVLTNKGSDGIDVTVSFILRNAKGRVAHEHRRGIRHFEGGKSMRFIYLNEWTKIISRPNKILTGEELTIEVEIYRVQRERPAALSPFARNLQKLLDDEDTADVSFDVQGTTIFAHKALLYANASVLATFCENSHKDTPVPISNMSPAIFRHVLRHVYGGEIPSYKVVRRHGIELLRAADQFDVVDLKLAVEQIIVHCGLISVTNVVDLLFLADGITCPLLKAHAMAYFVTRAKDVVNSKSFKSLTESGELNLEIIKTMLTDETSNCK